jgi:hypothetical protein
MRELLRSAFACASLGPLALDFQWIAEAIGEPHRYKDLSGETT